MVFDRLPGPLVAETSTEFHSAIGFAQEGAMQHRESRQRYSSFVLIANALTMAGVGEALWPEGGKEE